MTELDPVVEIEDIHLSIESPYADPVPILRGIDLCLRPGEVVGLVGESGSGKSMTARVMAGLLPQGSALTGRVRVKGRDLLPSDDEAWRRARIDTVAMVFQDPRAHLDPVRKIGHFLTEALVALNGVSRRDATARALQVLDDVGVSNPAARLRQYPHELSGGLLQRVMIASALLSEPDLLLADEPTTALDVTTQSELIAIVREQQAARGMAMLFITHDLDLAAAISDRVAVMYAGEVVESGPPSILESEPRHPYTAALLGARPGAFTARGRLVQLQGTPASAADFPVGCSFRSRCPLAVPTCETVHPELTTDGAQSWRCWRVTAGEGSAS